jgi:hypothetical protein
MQTIRKQTLINLFIGMALIVSAVVSVLVPSTLSAASPQQEICEGSGGTWANGKCTNANAGKSLEVSIKDVVNVLLFIIGAVAVIMIVVGGLKYTTSNGDSSAVTSAKNTILYAVVGLVVAILAYAIVNFVVGAF